MKKDEAVGGSLFLQKILDKRWKRWSLFALVWWSCYLIFAAYTNDPLFYIPERSILNLLGFAVASAIFLIMDVMVWRIQKLRLWYFTSLLILLIFGYRFVVVKCIALIFIIGGDAP